MKCVRATCSRKVNAPGNMCVPHYLASPHGFVDPQPARERVAALRRAGMSWPQIERVTGLSANGLKNMARWTENGKVCLDTHQRVMAVPVPEGFVEGLSRVPAVGTRRRIQALMYLGWTQGHIAKAAGIKDQQYVSTAMYRDHVSSSTAKRIAEVFEKLQWTPGPSKLIAKRAKRWGFQPPLAWDDLDDPDEQPNTGEATILLFPDRLREVTEELGIKDPDRAAEALGMTREAFDRQLYRYNLNTPVTKTRQPRSEEVPFTLTVWQPWDKPFNPARDRERAS